MSSVSSPLGTFFPQAFSPPAADQNSPVQRLQPAAQQTPAPVDTVTLSGYFSSLSQANSPAQPFQPAAATLGGSSNTLTSNAAPASGAATVVAAQNPAADPAPATGGTGALPAAVQAASSPINASPAAQQQELAQLDQVLQQLGIDPASIPLSEQLSMVLYLDDPAALAQLVQSLGQVVETAHLKGLGGTGATQPQNPDQVKSAPTETGLAAAAAANQNAPAGAPNQNLAAPPPQIAASAAAPAAAPVAAPAGNAAAAANAPNPAAPTTNGFAAQFQELQTSLQALGANSAAAAAPGAALNVVA